MQRPDASIIIPVYQAKKYINQCLDSVINQTYDNYEIIIIDDGSTDGSGEICDDYAMENPSIKVFHQANQGVTFARKRGLDCSSGKYIFWLDADDYFDHNLLKSVMDKAASSDANVIIWNSANVYGENNSIRIEPCAKLNDLSLNKRRTEILTGGYSVLWTFCAKRENWEQIVFPVNLAHAGEDGYLSMKILFNETKVVFIPDILYFHRRDSADSITHNRNALYYYDNYELWKYRYDASMNGYSDCTDYCGKRALSSIVKAYCLDMDDKQLSDSEYHSMLDFLQYLRNHPVSGRYRDKFLSWSIRNNFLLFCKMYSKYKKIYRN